MNAIVVVDKNWAIGKDGSLLVHLPGDLKYYRQKTLGKVIVVGRKTLESFPGGKPLPDRTNIVLTSDAAYEAPGCIICHSKDEVMETIAGYDPEDVFIAGGSQIYEQFMEDCDGFYVTMSLKLTDTFLIWMLPDIRSSGKVRCSRKKV